MLEIEIKVRVADLPAVRQKLVSLGAELLKERHHETNTLYDRRSGDLLARRQALRLRTAAKKSFLTFKGTPQKSRRFKVREEFETEVKNVGHLRKMLGALGYVPIFRYEKWRTVFRMKTLKICLDETAAGSFLEFEGEREKIVRMSKLLDLSARDWIRLDYIALLIKAGKGAPLPYSSSLTSPTTSSGSSSS